MERKISFKIIILLFLFSFFIFSSFIKPSDNEVFFIRNPKTRTEMIFNKDGKILLKAIDIDSENIGIIEDSFTKEQKYLFKVFNGEKKVETKYKSNDNEEYTDVYPSFRTVYYDLNGKDLGVSLDNVYGAAHAFSDYIIFFDSNAHILNVKTKEEKKTSHNYIEIFEDRVLLSTERYIDGPQSILICDKDLNVLKTIVGFALDKIEEVNGKKYYKISEKFSDAKINHYNLIDKDGNLLYDEPKEEEVDDYGSKDGKDEKLIKDRDSNIEWVETLYYKNKKIFVAHLKYIENVDEDGGLSYVFNIDVYNDKFEKVDVGSKNINTAIAKHGYLILDNKKIVDFDFSLVKEFDEASSFTSNEKDDKVFFTDMYDTEYNKKYKFNLYDEKFNLIVSNIEEISFDDFDKYIVIRGKNKTNFYDSDLNRIKEFDRRLSIRRFFGFNYPSFTDLDKNRMGIFDIDGNIIIDNLKQVCDISLNYFTFQNGFKYGLMDYSGKVLHEFSIFDNIKEDADDREYYDD